MRLGTSFLLDWTIQHRPHIHDRAQDALKQLDQALNVLLVPAPALFADPEFRSEVAPDLSQLQCQLLTEDRSRADAIGAQLEIPSLF